MANIIINSIKEQLNKNSPKDNVTMLEQIENYINKQKDIEREKIKETDDDIQERLNDFYEKEKLTKEQIKELSGFIVKKDHKKTKIDCADYYREIYYVYDIYYKKNKIVLTFEFVGPYDEDALEVYFFYDNNKEEMNETSIGEVIMHLKLKKIDKRTLFKYFSWICENEIYTELLCDNIKDYFDDGC